MLPVAEDRHEQLGEPARLQRAGCRRSRCAGSDRRSGPCARGPRCRRDQLDRRGLQVRVGELRELPASPTWAPSPSDAERAPSARPPGSRARRSSTALATPRGTTRAMSARGRGVRIEAARARPRRAARRAGTGCRRSPLGRRDEERVGVDGEPVGDERADRRRGQRRSRITSTAGSATRARPPASARDRGAAWRG